jgi:hypothetical protein
VGTHSDYGRIDVSTVMEESDMSKITKEQYEFALERIEELLPIVTDQRKNA